MFDVVVGSESFVVVSLPSPRSPLLDRLSPAERDVAYDAAAGMSNAAIAGRRKRSERTIANQLASVYRKLGVASRAQLAALLTEHPAR